MGARAWLRAGKGGGGKLTRRSEPAGIVLAATYQRLAPQLIDAFIERRQAKQKIGLGRATWISAAQRGATNNTAREVSVAINLKTAIWPAPSA